MDDRVGRKDNAGLNEEADMGAQGAAVIMARARERARRELRVRRPVLFATRGVVV
jgi:hypothetical protein